MEVKNFNGNVICWFKGHLKYKFREKKTFKVFSQSDFSDNQCQKLEKNTSNSPELKVFLTDQKLGCRHLDISNLRDTSMDLSIRIRCL